MPKYIHMILMGGLLWGGVSPLSAQKNLIPVLRANITSASKMTALSQKVLADPSIALASTVQKNSSRRHFSSAAMHNQEELLIQGLFSKKKENLSLLQSFKQVISLSLKRNSFFNPDSKQPFSIRELTKIPNEILENKEPTPLQRKVYESYLEVINLWKKRFDEKEEIPLLKIIFMPSLSPTLAALHTNKMSLLLSRKIADKFDWLRNYPNQGKKDFFSLHGDITADYLAARLERENLVFLGETHHFDEIHDNLSELFLKLRTENPSRRIVLFTEFIDLPPLESATHNTLFRYYRRIAETNLTPITLQDSKKINYAPLLFWTLLKQNIEIYPLEDPTQQKIFNEEFSSDVYKSVFGMAERNKVWARVIEYKMQEIRKENPDALFIVYGGIGHTSWLMPMALPKFFAAENPVVVEITHKRPSSVSSLYNVWGPDDPFFANEELPRLHHWKGDNARLLGRQTGFDYAWVVQKL